MKRYACVVGGANIDIIGTPFKSLNPNDSNPGRTYLTLGGVSRNIAENLSRLDIETEFITVLGSDTYAEEIIKDCKEKGIGLEHSKVLLGERTSSYLCINDEDGEMQVAISDMEIYSHITPAYISDKLSIINESMLCVVDTNIPEETLSFIMDNCNVPIFMDTVSVKKTEKIKNIIHNIYALKPNIIEAEILSGIYIKDYSDLERASSIIHNMGVKWIFVSLGPNGVYYSDGNTSGNLSPIGSKIVNTTGAGDSFIAGVVWSYLQNFDIEMCTKAGLAASSICVESPLTVSNDMSVANLEDKLSKNWR